MSEPVISKKEVIDAANILSELVQKDTTNPPGNEIAAANYIAEVMSGAGFEPKVFESAPGRGNIIARWEGQDKSLPALILHSHIDVVEADAKSWSKEPFGGEIAEGFVWGRGTLDMKGMTAMEMSTILKLKKDGFKPRRTIILVANADEEEGGIYGAGWLVDNCKELLEDAGFAIGEVGGFSLTLGRKRAYPIMVAEKGFTWFKLKATGIPGHGSIPRPDSAAVKIAQAAAALGTKRLKTNITPILKEFIHGLAGTQPFPVSAIFKMVANPLFTEFILDKLFPDKDQALAFFSLSRNTVSPTGFKGSEKINVIPHEAELYLDGRTLPGQTDDDLIMEVLDVVGDGYEVEMIRSMPPISADHNTELFSLMCDAIRKLDVDGIPLPNLVSGFTDAKHLARLGIVTYGYTPMKLDPDLAFLKLFHGIDERIPLSAIEFGLNAIHDVVKRFCE